MLRIESELLRKLLKRPEKLVKMMVKLMPPLRNSKMPLLRPERKLPELVKLVKTEKMEKPVKTERKEMEKMEAKEMKRKTLKPLLKVVNYEIIHFSIIMIYLS